MTKDIRKNIDATAKLNESLSEGPVGWAGNKLAKAGGRIGGAVTTGQTSAKLKRGVRIRSGAQDLITAWNKDFGSKGMERTPANVLRYLSKQQNLQMSEDELRDTWNSVPALTSKYGTFDEIQNAIVQKDIKDPEGVSSKTDEPPREGDPQPGEQHQGAGTTPSPFRPVKPRASGLSANPSDRILDSIQEARSPIDKEVSVNDLRNLFIQAIRVKNKAQAAGKLGDVPGTEPEEPTKVAPSDTQGPDVIDMQPTRTPKGITYKDVAPGEPYFDGEKWSDEDDEDREWQQRNKDEREQQIKDLDAADDKRQAELKARQAKGSDWGDDEDEKVKKAAGAKDTDNDGDYDYNDLADTAIEQGKGSEAMAAFLKKMAAAGGSDADKAALAYSVLFNKSPNIKG